MIRSYHGFDDSLSPTYGLDDSLSPEVGLDDTLPPFRPHTSRLDDSLSP